jgi:hypothetical protein
MALDHTHTTKVAYKELGFDLATTIRVNAMTLVQMPKSLADKLNPKESAIYGFAVQGDITATVDIDLNGKRIQVPGIQMETQGAMAMRVCDLASMRVLLDRAVATMSPELLAEFETALFQAQDLIKGAPFMAFDTEAEAAKAAEQFEASQRPGPHGPYCICPPEDAAPLNPPHPQDCVCGHVGCGSEVGE